MYDVVKENVESTKLFAILPDSTDYSGIYLLPQSFSFHPWINVSLYYAHKWSLNGGPEFGLWNLRVLSCHWHLVYCLIFAWWDPGAVRRITTKICLRRHIELPKDVSVSSHAKSEVTTSETKSRAGTWTHDSLFQETDLRARAEVLSMIWWFSRVILLILLQNSLLFPSPIV